VAVAVSRPAIAGGSVVHSPWVNSVVR